MKIVNVCLNGVFTDGLGYQDNLLPKYQKKLGYDVSIIAPEWELNRGKIMRALSAEKINNDGIKIIRLKQKNSKKAVSYPLKKYPALYAKLEAEKPDIIFFHGFQMLDSLTIIRYLKVHSNVKCYVDSHADEYNSGKNFISRLILHKMLWRYCAHQLIPYVKKFYGVTNSRLNYLIEMYHLPQEKCELLVMGIDDEQAEHAKNKRNLLSHIDTKDNLVVLTGGKIDSNKKQILSFIRAFKSLNLSNVILVFFGSVSPEYEADFNSMLSDNVINLGWKNNEEIYELFFSSNLIVFPGLHSVMWEQAVGCGKPCIFKRIKGFEHIDKDGNCAFFETDSENEYQKVLVDVLKTINNMSEIAQNVGPNQFSYYEIAKKSIEYKGEN